MQDVLALDSKRRRLLSGLHGDPDLSETWDMGPPIPAPDLRGKPDEEAAAAMVEWFRDNFDDPVQETPWDEGEYVYVWGGPYEAREQLEDAFANTASEAAIAAAVSEIERDGFEWAPSSSRTEPEISSDPVICAKQRVHQQIRGWCFEADDSADPETVKLPFRIADIALLLCEHRRLSKHLDRIKTAATALFDATKGEAK